MSFISILDMEDVDSRDLVAPSFFQDLNLDQVIERIYRVWGGKIQELYYYFPSNKETEQYRRDIYTDIKNCNLFEPLKDFVNDMDLYFTANNYSERLDMKIQKKVWHLQAAVYYCDALDLLNNILSKANTKSEGMNSLKSFLNDYLSSKEYKTIYEKCHEIKKELSELNVNITYNGDRLIVAALTEDEITHNNSLMISKDIYDNGDKKESTSLKNNDSIIEEVNDTELNCSDFEDLLNVLFPEHPHNFETPFTTSEDLSPIEYEIYLLLRKIKSKLFDSIDYFYGEHRDFTSKVLIKLYSEIKFYLSFHAFTVEMNNFGFEFSTPTVDENKKFAATDLYDLALACVNSGEDKAVVSNSFEYKDGENFFVLTGPNQGGKTTFARSLGQLVFFTKMGLDVPAKNANLHYFADMLTHFSVEESVESGRGKLKEELIRLAPMMSVSKTNSFVIINELFTTAANYDASIMGKKVLEHFIDLKCTGIYVTHIKELSEGHPNIVSLRAMLDENKKQCFKIMRAEANEDACAVNQINKYHLNYDEIKQRLAGKNL